MNTGAATRKMMVLVGNKELTWAMKLYTTIRAVTKKQDKGYSAEVLLDRLKQIYKALRGLKGYMTDEGELGIYSSILWNIGLYEKSALLLDLILRIHSNNKPGPKAKYAVDTLIFLLKQYHDMTNPKVPFWEPLAKFLIEQNIEREDYAILAESLKTRYNQRIKKQYDVFIKDQKILSILYDLQSFPKHERPQAVKPLISPELIREYLSKNIKKQPIL